MSARYWQITIRATLEASRQFWRLLRLVDNDRDRALGKIARFQRLALDHFLVDRGIPKAVLIEDELGEMIDAGFAIHCSDSSPDEYQWIDAVEDFEWARKQKHKAKAGGTARAKGPRDSKGRYVQAQPATSQDPATASQDPAPSSATATATAIAPATPIATASANAPIQKDKEGNADAHAPALPIILNSYKTAWEKRYGKPPMIIGRDRGQLTQFLSEQRLSAEQACALIAQYVASNDPWICKNHHDLSTFMAKPNLIIEPAPSTRDWNKICVRAEPSEDTP